MLGEALALGAAVAWALSVILFKRSEEITPLALNLFKNVLAALLLLATLFALGEGFDLGRNAKEWWCLIFSGVIGIAVADTVFFAALRRLGAGLLAIVECAYAPIMVFLGMVVHGERPNPAFGVGGALVVCGIFLVVTDRRSLGSERLIDSLRAHLPGVFMGVFCVACMGVGVVIAKPIFEKGQLVETSLVRLLAGVIALWIWILLSKRTRECHAVFRPRRVWRSLIPASILGCYLAMLMWIGGFKYADMSVAAVLNQTSTVFIIVLARIFVGEPLTRRRSLGGAIAMAGAMLVLIYEY